jgi:hypothetical protein
LSIIGMDYAKLVHKGDLLARSSAKVTICRAINRELRNA